MVKTVNGSVLLDTKALKGLVASDLNVNNPIHPAKTFTKENVSAFKDVPRPELTQRWTHLRCIEAELNSAKVAGAIIGLLIG